MLSWSVLWGCAMVNHSSSSDQAPLALARKKRGWTQAYVAEQVDVSIDAVRRWESGRIPYPSSIQKLCRLFAMSPQELGLFQDPHQRMATQAWRPDEAEKQAAWEIHVELVTRVPMTILEDDRGLLHEALTSFYSLFQTTRIILRQLGLSRLLLTPSQSGPSHFWPSECLIWPCVLSSQSGTPCLKTMRIGGQ